MERWKWGLGCVTTGASAGSHRKPGEAENVKPLQPSEPQEHLHFSPAILVLCCWPLELWGDKCLLPEVTSGKPTTGSRYSSPVEHQGRMFFVVHGAGWQKGQMESQEPKSHLMSCIAINFRWIKALIVNYNEHEKDNIQKHMHELGVN